MTKTEIIVNTLEDREVACNVVMARGNPPFTVTITDGKPRSNKQNRLYHGYLSQLSEQGDMTAKEYEARCKLEIGVPILCAADPEYREFYYKHIKPFSYEKKLVMMLEPFGFPVTRLMKTKQMVEFTNEVYSIYTAQGFYLEHPDDAGR